MDKEKIEQILVEYGVSFTDALADRLLEEFKPCDDAISRQAVTDTTICEGISCNECSFNTCEDGQAGCLLKERVDKLPPVTPQQKTGHWIEHPEIETTTPEYLMFYECSECGNKQCFYKADTHRRNYCGKCGAKMFEPQERSDKE